MQLSRDTVILLLTLGDKHLKSYLTDAEKINLLVNNQVFFTKDTIITIRN